MPAAVQVTTTVWAEACQACTKRYTVTRQLCAQDRANYAPGLFCGNHLFESEKHVQIVSAAQRS